MQESEEEEVHAALLVRDDALGDLLGRSEQLCAEAVVVLHQILEARVRPHPLPVRRRRAGLLHRTTESFDGGTVRLSDDLPQLFARLGFGVADDRERVQTEPHGAAVFGGDPRDVVVLLGEAVEVLAVGEVPVGVRPAVEPRRRRISALEDLRMPAPLDRIRAGTQREVVHAVEVAVEVDVLLRPECAQHLDELGGAAIALVVFQPRESELRVLVLEPAADDVHRGAAVGELVSGQDVLRQHRRLPQARVHGRNDLETLGREQQRKTDRGRLVLLSCAVARQVTHLAEGVLEPDALRRLGESHVVLVVPRRALLDVRDDQSPADIGDPVREPKRLMEERRRIGHDDTIRRPGVRVNRCVGVCLHVTSCEDTHRNVRFRRRHPGWSSDA